MPTTPLFTHYTSKAAPSRSDAARLDYIFPALSIADRAVAVGVALCAGPEHRPDHDAVFAEFLLPSAVPRATPRYRFDDRILQLQRFREKVETIVQRARAGHLAGWNYVPDTGTPEWLDWFDALWAEIIRAAKDTRFALNSAAAAQRAEVTADIRRVAEDLAAAANESEEQGELLDMLRDSVSEFWALADSSRAARRAAARARALDQVLRLDPSVARAIRFGDAAHSIPALHSPDTAPRPPSEPEGLTTDPALIAARVHRHFQAMNTARRPMSEHATPWPAPTVLGLPSRGAVQIPSGQPGERLESDMESPSIAALEARLRRLFLLRPGASLSKAEAEFLLRVWDLLPLHARRAIAGQITSGEALEVLRSMNARTSPGRDGLTVKFYLHFWDILGDLVVESFRTAEAVGCFSLRQRTGLMILLYKKGARDRIENWRPITIMPIDFRLFGAIMARRMNTHAMHHTTSPCQAGFMPGRAGAGNVYLLQALVRLAEREGLCVAGFNKDFRQAYDRVEHVWALRTVATIAYPDDFVFKLRASLKGIRVFIVINGVEYKVAVLVDCSTLQGNPMSCALFNTQQEPYTRAILADPRIPGVLIPNPRGGPPVRIVLVIFADDNFAITILPAGDPAAPCSSS
eukprot:tig00021135_g18967.t1